MAVTEITMPALSPTMESGKIVEWKFKEGDKFKNGDVLFTIETDKAIMEFETADDGILGKILIHDGAENVKVGEVLGYMKDHENDVIPDIISSSSDIQQVEFISNSTEAVEEISMNTDLQTNINQNSYTHDIIKTKEIEYGKNYFSTPAARARAKLLNLDINDIISSQSSKVREQDVIDFKDNKHKTIDVSTIKSDHAQVDTKNSQHVQQCNIGIPQGHHANTVQYQLSNIQNVIAKRMHMSKTQSPHFYIKSKCYINELLELKNTFKNKGINTTLTHWLVSITAKALQKYPKMNSEFINDTVYQHVHSDIALAMSVGDTLITPVIRSAEMKTIDMIALETQELIGKVKNGTLSANEYQNGSFTISNVGMYGVDECISIINPPQVAIMGVGAFSTELKLVDGAIVENKVINITLSVDHRVINGSYACEFLHSIKSMIECPMMML